MTWLWVVLGVVLGVPLLGMAVGALLPRDHVARMSITLGSPPARVWGLVSDVTGSARWRKDIERIESGPPVDGRVRFVEVSKQGKVPFDVVSQEPPKRQVVRVVDDGLPFGGTWTWELTPMGAGTRLTVTEAGFIRNPLFRVMGKLFFRPSATIARYLQALAAELGESAEPEVASP